MTFQNGLKAGAIGAAVAVVLTLLGLIPVIGCCTFVLTLVLWVATGVGPTRRRRPAKRPRRVRLPAS
jgi:hypothetical protein